MPDALTITKAEFYALESIERNRPDAHEFAADISALRAIFNGGQAVLALTIDSSEYSTPFRNVAKRYGIGKQG